MVSAAISQLADAGWITPDSKGWYLAVPPPSQRTGTLYEAAYQGQRLADIDFTDKLPAAIEAPKPRAPLVPTLPDHPLKVPERKIRYRRLESNCTYLIGIDGLPLVKIGRTSADPKKRLRILQTGQPLKLSLLWHCEGDYEADLHVHFDDYHYRGEWFDLSSLGDPVEVVKAAVAEIKAASD